MREVFAEELRTRRRGVVIWTLAVATLLALVLWIQPTMARQGSALEAKLALLPAALRKVFGLDGLDFRRPAGYLAVNFLYVTLTAPLLFGLRGAGVIAREEVDRTAELLFTQPISRRRILLAKAAAVTVHLVAFHAVLIAITLGGLAIVVDGPIEAPLITALFGGTTALAICFAGLGMLVATLVRRPSVAANAALAVVLGGYLLSVLGALSPQLDGLALSSPFHWVAPTRILATGGLDAGAAAVAGVGVVAGALAILRYERRDILS